MKIHAKKKAHQRALKKAALAGFMNDVDGRMIARAGAKDTSMKRDYYPQRLG